MSVKGKGQMHTYFVLPPRRRRSSLTMLNDGVGDALNRLGLFGGSEMSPFAKAKQRAGRGESSGGVERRAERAERRMSAASERRASTGSNVDAMGSFVRSRKGSLEVVDGEGRRRNSLVSESGGTLRNSLLRDSDGGERSNTPGLRRGDSASPVIGADGTLQPQPGNRRRSFTFGMLPLLPGSKKVAPGVGETSETSGRNRHSETDHDAGGLGRSPLPLRSGEERPNQPPLRSNP